MIADHSYKDRQWQQQPDAEALLNETLETLLAGCEQASLWRSQLLESCAVRLRDIVDHISGLDDELIARAQDVGWQKVTEGVWENPAGLFPALISGPGKPVVWVRVEDIEVFCAVNAVSGSIEGKAYAPARRVVAFTGVTADLGAFERSGHSGFDIPEVDDALIARARRHRQAFGARRREFDSVEAGLDFTEALVDAAVDDLGQHWSCDLWFKAEREFWMRRCVAGRLQKIRQDGMGIGWSNIDHHTYDGSREHFRRTVQILEKLGYELREMLYAGELAGWGSQVLEQPALKSTIFADVDLSPEELAIDFAHETLPPLDKHRRAGVLSIMHGESILEAGLNHVAGLYDWRVLQAQLKTMGIDVMAPFSDFSHLYQELTIGDWGAVDPARIDVLEAGGHLPAEEAEKIRQEGAIVTHLENIERNNGFKGFNREGIDGVLRKLDPRAYASNRSVAQ